MFRFLWTPLRPKQFFTEKSPASLSGPAYNYPQMRLRRKLSKGRPLRRSNPPTVIGSLSGAPLPALWRMRCMCGTILEIAESDDGKRQTCATCNRLFDIRFSEDVNSGQKGVSLQYLTDEKKSNGETSTVGAGTTSFQMPGSTRDPRAMTNSLGLKIEPEPPDEAHFRCTCKVLLAIPKAQYEKRSRCPACGARMLVFMLFDPASEGFTLQLFSLIDKSTGQTQVLSKL